MNSSRYMLVEDRFPYPVKRRARGPREGKGAEPAITLLPPDPYLIMERPDFARSSSPTMYRTAPPKSAKNKEASSFVILGETMNTPVQSRPGSPSGRVSPFRGHGFKSPATSRPNSRAPSPTESSEKIRPNRPVKIIDKPRIGKDIGLPPKSPAKPRLEDLEAKPTPASKDIEKLETAERTEVKADKDMKLSPEKEPETKMVDATSPSTEVDESSRAKEVTETAEKQLEQSEDAIVTQEPPPAKRRLTPAPPRDKKPPVSPTPKVRTKTETTGQESIIKSSKPPIPPKKIGVKTSLKTDENGKENIKKSGKQVTRNKFAGKENEKIKEISEASENVSKSDKISKEKDTKAKAKIEEQKQKVNATNGEGKKAEKKEKADVADGEGRKAEEPNGEGKKSEKKEKANAADDEGRKAAEAKEEGRNAEKTGEETRSLEVAEKKQEKLVPCFQPDKCQIAPPTMASPSPITTPTISTPSTTADLSTSPVKNSQSIAAAPTTVTPSSLSSVSSTVVLTGNLARRELGARNKSKEAEAGVGATESSLPEKVSGQMVKAASKDSIKWSDRDNLSGEITSTTRLIKAEPEMEVLSPNNLRDSPPRMPPPNLAWDEGRLPAVPNGDVPNKAEATGRFRRFVSAVWRFLCYLCCCRCLKVPKCCRRPRQEGQPKTSTFSRLNCCKGKSCRNPFACCAACCKPNGEGKRCCRRNPKPGNPKPKSRKCCAKPKCSCKGCCDKIRTGCLNVREKINGACRSLFCLNLTCCQNFLKKFKFCHKMKCCQKNGFCSCCNPNLKKETKKLNKKGSRASNNSRDKDNLDVVLVEHTSLMKAAIPVLPSCLAVFCLILNLFLPGFGTFLSGILCLCFGKPRFSVKDTPKNRVGSFILNTIIGVAQLFTVVFCLVGWGWSIWWGMIMYKLSRRQKRLKLAEKNQKEAEGSNVNHNHVDVEQG